MEHPTGWEGHRREWESHCCHLQEVRRVLGRIGRVGSEEERPCHQAPEAENRNTGLQRGKNNMGTLHTSSTHTLRRIRILPLETPLKRRVAGLRRDICWGIHHLVPRPTGPFLGFGHRSHCGGGRRSRPLPQARPPPLSSPSNFPLLLLLLLHIPLSIALEIHLFVRLFCSLSLSLIFASVCLCLSICLMGCLSLSDCVSVSFSLMCCLCCLTFRPHAPTVRVSRRVSQVNFANSLDVERDRQLLTLVLNFVSMCAQISKNRRVLAQKDGIGVLLSKMQMCVQCNDDGGSNDAVIQTTLSIAAAVASEVSQASHKGEAWTQKRCLHASADTIRAQMASLLEHLAAIHANEKLAKTVFALLPFLTRGDHDNIVFLISYFKDHLNFDDVDHGMSRPTDATQKSSEFYMACPSAYLCL